MSSIYRTLTYVVCLSTGTLWFPQPYSYLCNYLLFIQRYISTMNGICKEALSYIPMWFPYALWLKLAEGDSIHDVRDNAHSLQFFVLFTTSTIRNYIF